MSLGGGHALLRFGTLAVVYLYLAVFLIRTHERRERGVNKISYQIASGIDTPQGCGIIRYIVESPRQSGFQHDDEETA